MKLVVGMPLLYDVTVMRNDVGLIESLRTVELLKQVNSNTNSYANLLANNNS